MPGTVFVTVGTTKFDALIAAVDTPEVAEALIARGYDRLVMQVGAGDYKPSRLCPLGSRSGAPPDGLAVEHFDFASALNERIAAAELVISHAGAGSLFEALGAGKPVVAVPNALLMHNHQAELAEHLANLGHCIAATPDTLAQTLRAMDLGALKPYQPGDPSGIAAAIDRLMGFKQQEKH